MRKLSNCVISCLLCLICMLPLSPIQVFAAGAIDVDKDVHLKIQYIHDKSPVSDVPLTFTMLPVSMPMVSLRLPVIFKNIPSWSTA